MKLASIRLFLLETMARNGGSDSKLVKEHNAVIYSTLWWYITIAEQDTEF